MKDRRRLRCSAANTQSTHLHVHRCVHQSSQLLSTDCSSLNFFQDGDRLGSKQFYASLDWPWRQSNNQVGILQPAIFLGNNSIKDTVTPEDASIPAVYHTLESDA
jgi:hypothetical protein